ncbi:TetR family transcriptional regulator C-terminal domain-containing protein [Streptomyces sp. NPDC058086]|uniref:TetR family transcriptional regulator C-terminal domain-containing protein n=1 Tax=Streptomyces sp. NPDC058086 TaxID=3346334 RepID=UPI0036EF0BEF
MEQLAPPSPPASYARAPLDALVEGVVRSAVTGFFKGGLLDGADVLDGWCIQYGGDRAEEEQCTVVAPVCVLRRSEGHDVERFFAVEAHSAAEFFAALVGLADYNSRRPGRTKMFNVLLAEAGDPGHPAHAFFVKRCADLVEVSAGALREAVASGELKPDTDCEALAEEFAAVMDGIQLQWALDPAGVDMAARMRAYLDRSLRSITVSGAGLPSDAHTG